jgi:hypothetical protein
MEIKSDFAFTPAPRIPLAIPPNPLGPLTDMLGVWEGHGFNMIWRPFRDPAVPAQDRFLELNLTTEDLEITQIKGNIPNRGLLQTDINLFGATYLQQIKDSNTKGGLHIEPGIWVNVPSTTDPSEAGTVVRMASIPHGTTINAQGTASGVIAGAPTIPPVSIVPFLIGNPAHQIPFPESNLSVPTAFRSAPGDIDGVTQAMVDNPNSVLQSALQGQTIESFVALRVSSVVSTGSTPNAGGGTDNIAFLTGAAPSNQPNADAATVSATFWIEKVKGAGGRPDFLQLQYTQTVLLNFKGLSWPHVTVGTLRHHRH